MRKVLYGLVFLTTFLIQLGCDGFTRRIEVDYSDHITKGVIFGVLTNTNILDTAFSRLHYIWTNESDTRSNRIYITHSMPPTFGRELYYSADVNLRSAMGDLGLTFIEQDLEQNNFHSYFVVTDEMIPGKVYDISAAFDPAAAPQYVSEWAPVSARDTMPSLVQFVVEDVRLEYEDANPSATPDRGYFDVQIADEPNRENVYLVDISAIFQPDTMHAQNPFLSYGRIERPDKTTELEFFENSRDNLFLEDDFNGEGRKRIHFRLSNPYGVYDREKEVVLIIRISNLSNNYIRFYRSSQQYAVNRGNPFAEPVEIFTNVDNGYGIFALAARSYAVVEVK